MNTDYCKKELDSTETTGGIELDGEAWKERDDTTYTSLLDLYGVPDLFTETITDKYENKREEECLTEQELVEFVISGKIDDDNKTNGEEELIEFIFSQEISLSKIKSYDKEEEGHITMLVMTGIFVVLAFCLFMVRFNIKRQNRREKYGTEIDLEN